MVDHGALAPDSDRNVGSFPTFGAANMDFFPQDKLPRDDDALFDHGNDRQVPFSHDIRDDVDVPLDWDPDHIYFDMARLQPFFPKSHGKPRVDDRRVLSGIIFINRNGLRWRDAPKEYGPPKTLYNRWKRWSDKGVFARMLAGLASEAAVPKTVMIDATYLKAHRTATSLRSKKGGQATRGAV
ncbi:hypothetical protein PLESTB_001832600 [Pleodorina starrii]|uniref:Insertion element IS402-like domain-containing protein n=1 Tax=Pleodorina starrii TaxID=330485 RepID=A0A9W6FA34_9CHLO|nr:hypothetical protein PLESTB_001832600 [Pleodorina starrii]